MALDPTACPDRESCLAPNDTCNDMPDKQMNCDQLPGNTCSDNSQCASGVCQSLPAVGLSVCIEPLQEGMDCPEGYTEFSGYCIPGREICGLCETPPDETCNGRDDNCDGIIDGADVCAEKNITQMCHSDADCPALEDGTLTHCLARSCHPV